MLDSCVAATSYVIPNASVLKACVMSIVMFVIGREVCVQLKDARDVPRLA